MFYKLPPRVRMFIEKVAWTGGAYLATGGLIAMLQGQAGSPEWWHILIWLIAAGVAAWIQKVPFHITATDRSRLQLTKDEMQALR
jgi:hypothetical protein